MIDWILKLIKGRPEPLPLSHPLFTTVDSGFQLYVKLVSENPEWDDDRIIEELQNQEVEKELAQELAYFVPSAFGRPIVKSMGVSLSDDYILNNTFDNSRKKLPLANVMSFAWANNKIEEFRVPERFETFMLIAQRSAEMSSVNSTSQAGVAIKNLAGSACGPTIVTMRKVSNPKV